MENKIPKIANQVPSILFCLITKSEIMPNINPTKELMLNINVNIKKKFNGYDRNDRNKRRIE